jgi:hypothetical protein
MMTAMVLISWFPLPFHNDLLIKTPFVTPCKYIRLSILSKFFMYNDDERLLCFLLLERVFPNFAVKILDSPYGFSTVYMFQWNRSDG